MSCRRAPTLEGAIRGPNVPLQSDRGTGIVGEEQGYEPRRGTVIVQLFAAHSISGGASTHRIETPSRHYQTRRQILELMHGRRQWKYENLNIMSQHDALAVDLESRGRKFIDKNGQGILDENSPQLTIAAEVLWHPCTEM